MKKVSRWAVLLMLSALAVQVVAENGAKPDAVKNAPKPDAAMTAGMDSDYKIGADDSLKISVWKEPDLTETLPVRPDGKISMPLLGDVVAAGLTPGELGLSITEKL